MLDCNLALSSFARGSSLRVWHEAFQSLKPLSEWTELSRSHLCLCDTLLKGGIAERGCVFE